MVARYFFLALLSFSACPCLAVAYQNLQTFFSLPCINPNNGILVILPFYLSIPARGPCPSVVLVLRAVARIKFRRERVITFLSRYPDERGRSLLPSFSAGAVNCPHK